MSFKYKIGQRVTVSVSGETGEIRARAEYKNSTDCYYVYYKSGDGRAISTWWDEDQIEAVKEEEKPKKTSSKKPATKKPATRKVKKPKQEEIEEDFEDEDDEDFEEEDDEDFEEEDDEDDEEEDDDEEERG